MVILYESEYHNINPQTPGDGGWLWNKMFQTMHRFHDTDINVSTVMISDVMHRHRPRDFVGVDKVPHFPDIATHYLKAHVRVVALVLEYNTKTL